MRINAIEKEKEIQQVISHIYPISATLVNAALRFFFGGSTCTLSELALALGCESELMDFRIPPWLSSTLETGVNGGGESAVRRFVGIVGATTGE